MEKKLLALSLACLLLAGCGGPESPGISVSSGSQSGGVAEDSSQAAPPEVQYQVQTDWSVLEGGASEPLPPAVGRRWYPDYTDHLIPSGSYGTLIPFAGARVYTKAWWEEDGGYTSPAFLYGLMTAGFFPEHAGMVVLGLCLLGPVMALLSGLLVKRLLLKG